MEKMESTATPRDADDEPSEVIVDASGYSPPTPKPRMARQITSCSYTLLPMPVGCADVPDHNPFAASGECTACPAADVALPSAPTMMSVLVITKHHLRPKRSPASPKNSCPRMEPTSAALFTAFFRSPVCAAHGASERSDAGNRARGGTKRSRPVKEKNARQRPHARTCIW